MKRSYITKLVKEEIVVTEVTGGIRLFDQDGDIAAGGRKMEAAFFLNFSRLLTKDEIKKGIAEIAHQLQENEKEINETPEQEKEGYIESYQGRFIMLSIFILIIIAMYFLRRRLSKVRLGED